MGDEMNFDLCECISSHEFAMHRLMSLLRQSQSHCTDSECFVDGAQPQRNTQPEYYLFITVMVMIAFFIRYWLHQNRRTRDEPTKVRGNNHDFNGSPPPTSL